MSLQKRDADINRVYAMEEVHSIIPYALKGYSKEHSVLNACSRILINGHDYWFDEGVWYLTYVGLEYLIAFYRGCEEIDLLSFGNTHILLNMTRFVTSSDCPKPTNMFAPRVKMEKSALMRAGLVNKWYPINDTGLQHFTSVWNGKDYLVWNEFRQLCSSLDTGRYVRFVRHCNKPRTFDNYNMFKSLNERNWFVHKHPDFSGLWTLKSVKPILES